MNENLPSFDERVEDLLEKVADITRQCRACGETIYFVRHRVSGRLAPYTRDAINHFVNCPGAKQFKRAAGTSR